MDNQSPILIRTTVGVVGAGAISSTAHIPVLRAMQDVQIAWITDVNESRGRAAARHNGVPFASAREGPEGLPPCQVVLLAIPLPPRGPYFDHCARTGIAVLAEKPLANSAFEHANVTARFQSWQLAVGYQRRYYATSLLLRSVIDEGVFGPLRRIRIQEGGRIHRTGGLGAYQDVPNADGGGVMKNMGCHSLDLVLWLTKARGCAIRDLKVEWDGATDRHASARLQFHDVLGTAGQSCEIDWTVSWLEPQSNNYEFEFDDAVLRCPIAPSDKIELLSKEHRYLGGLVAPLNHGATTSMQAFYLEWRDILTSLRTGCEPELSATSCQQVARVLDDLSLA